MREIPVPDRPIVEGIAFLEIGDRGGIQSIVGELPHIALEHTREDFQFAENTEGAIVFPVSQFDPIGTAALVQWIHLLGEMLNVSLAQSGIHSFRS